MDAVSWQMRKMKGYYENNNPWYFDLKYKVYVPIDLKRYRIPVPYGKHARLSHENRLVNHIFETVYQRNMEKDPTQEGIDDLFKDRLGLVRSKIELILLQLEQRRKINYEVLCQIDHDSCEAQNLIFQLGYRAYRMDKDRLSLEKIKFDLEDQGRMEKVSYFRDTGLLNKDLKDTLIQYLSEIQKNKIIGLEG